MRFFDFANLFNAPPDANGERSVVTRIGAKKYRMRSDDKYLDQIRGVFERDMVKLFDSLLRDGDCVLDIGANIGCTSLLFSQRARQVYGFEPSPSTFRLLQQNLNAANAGNVEAVNVGLGKSAGSFELTFSADNRSGGFVSDRVQASAGHQVEQIRIIDGDAWMREAQVGQVDFIKIDVEGFEQHVIEGLAQTIERCKPVVVLELNHWSLNAFQRTSVPDFFDFLRGVFPLLYAVDRADMRNLHDPNDAYHVMYHHIVNNFRYPNLIGAFGADRLPQRSKT